MVLLFIPILGFFLYLIFGKPISKRRIFVWDSKSRLGLKAAVQSQLRAIETDELEYQDSDIARYNSLIYLNLRTDASLFSQDNAIEVFLDGKEKFDRLLQDMRRAKDHIHLVYYIVRDDELGTKLADVLIKKANEGVTVRFLYDAMGSRSLSKNILNDCVHQVLRLKHSFQQRSLTLKLTIETIASWRSLTVKSVTSAALILVMNILGKIRSSDIGVIRIFV